MKQWTVDLQCRRCGERWTTSLQSDEKPTVAEDECPDCGQRGAKRILRASST